MTEAEKLEALRSLLNENWPELSPTQVEALLVFYGLVLRENEIQNLTRLIEPADFYFGHLVDVRELLKSGLIAYPALDLGSGGGVPGLACALLDQNAWALVDSEKKKAEFLRSAAAALSLSQVQVFGERVEAVLARKERFETVVARAVGPVSRIYAWIEGCSTWNKLVLLKGPSWNEEWAEFQASRWRKRLTLKKVHAYEVGPEKKSRVIVELARS